MEDLGGWRPGVFTFDCGIQCRLLIVGVQEAEEGALHEAEIRSHRETDRTADCSWVRRGRKDRQHGSADAINRR